MGEQGPDTSDVQESRKRKIYNFSCECGKNFNHKNHFNAHQRKVHNVLNSTLNSYTEKRCPLCDFSATLRNEMIKHCEIIHNIKFVEEKLTFTSQDEFLSWKRKLESDTNSKFINKGTKKFLKHTLTQFNCHRSGCYATKGKGLRSLKTQGSVKMNSFCPSRMIQKCFNDGTCVVDFFSPHVGHQNEIKHLTLTHTEREELAKKLSLKIPFDEILDQIRDPLNDCSLQRIHLLTRKDLYNIEAAYNLQSKAVRHKPQDIVENDDSAEVYCSSEISELSRNTPVHDDVQERKDKLKTTILETLYNISSSEEMDFMEKYFAKAGPTLAAIKNKSLSSFQLKSICVSNKNIAPQIGLFSTKKKKVSKNNKNITSSTITTFDVNRNAMSLLNKQ